MNTVTGRFEVKGTPLDADDATKAVGAVRTRFDKQFSGPLEARGIVTFLGLFDKATGSGGYVGFELVEGVLEGRKGAFRLQHSGAMSRGKQELSITVVPDSGTGDLLGIAGRMTIDIKAGGEHFYTFEYSLP